MKVVLDTNVLVSGIFFSGPPFRILQAWRDRQIRLVLSQEIIAEYQRVGNELAGQFPDIDLAAFLELLTIHSELIAAPPHAGPVCIAPDDDKFLACAWAARAGIVITGDKHLLSVGKYRGIEMLTPRRFVDAFLA